MPRSTSSAALLCPALLYSSASAMAASSCVSLSMLEPAQCQVLPSVPAQKIPTSLCTSCKESGSWTYFHTYNADSSSVLG